MNRKKILLNIGILSTLALAWLFLNTQKANNNKPEDVKIALREVGHKMLLTNSDSTSLVLPVKQLTNLKYSLKFEDALAIEPTTLVSVIRHSFNRSDLFGNYIVEVIQCTDNEVAYSYKVRNEKEKNIIPCKGRSLPKACYEIEVWFLYGQNVRFVQNILLGILLLFVFNLLWIITKSRKKQGQQSLENEKEYIVLGQYLFYPDQSKLTSREKEVQLSKKEGELLSIMVAHRNQVVKREDLTKKIWEDNGVVVGRSLDTYISKLRKRFIDDQSVKLTNVHGVGYKLECD